MMHELVFMPRRRLPAVLWLGLAALAGRLDAQQAPATAERSPAGRSPTEPSAETHFVPAGIRGLRVALHHQPPAPGARTAAAPVLLIHGATFPSALAAAYRFDGVSWMDDLARRGYDVWALDFLGYGAADRYPEMWQRPGDSPPLGRAPDAARQIGAAVEFIRSRAGAERVSLVAHSWGTMPAALYAGDHPAQVERLVLFGPVTRRDPAANASGLEASAAEASGAALPAYGYVTVAEQEARFAGYVPHGEPPALDARHLAAWGPAYLASDPSSGARAPASVQVPNGPQADLVAAWSGRLAYDPARIAVPTLIVRGEWDVVTTDEDARRLYDMLRGAPLKRDVKISRGTHVMHLEESRYQLYQEVATFLAAEDMP